MNRKFVGTILAILAITLGLFTAYDISKGDGIEPGKIYGISMTFMGTVKGVPVRQFDFKDRNLPRTSVVAPIRDGRGMPLVRENTSLPPSTVRKVVGWVSTQTVEGVTYPGYPYTLWEYHMSVKEPQSVVPEITPAR